MDTEKSNNLISEFTKAYLAYKDSSDQIMQRLERLKKQVLTSGDSALDDVELITPGLFNDHMKRLGAYLNAYYNLNEGKPDVNRAVAVQYLAEAKKAAILGLDDQSNKLMSFARTSIIKNALAAHKNFRVLPNKVNAKKFLVAMKEVSIMSFDDSPEIINIGPDFNKAVEIASQ